MSKQIRIILKSFDPRVLEQATARILNSVKATGGLVKGPVPLPNKKNIYTARRSPHVNEDSRAQFEITEHKRLIDMKAANSSLIEALMKLDLPSNVKADVTVHNKP